MYEIKEKFWVGTGRVMEHTIRPKITKDLQ